jgi:outer membrane protein OmpA-like peptidoglycan-associated protein
MRKITFLVLLTVLFTTSLFAQQQLWDTTFVASLRNNKDYAKGFNAKEYNPKILKACILDAINVARKQYKEMRGDALTNNDILESAAMNQAETMARDEVKSTEGIGVMKTTARRVKSFGGTQFVDEVVNKVKTSRGNDNYSYLDVVTDFMLPILNHQKKSLVLLQRKWALAGIGFASDENMKNIYISVVFGNAKSLNPTAKRANDLAVPFSTKKFGLKGYDIKKCKKCDQAKNLEDLQKGLVVKDGYIYFEYKDYKQLRRLIGKSTDGLAVDIVFRDQFKCEDENIMDNNLVNRGFMTKRIFIKKIIKNNENTDKKSKRLYVELAEFPKEITGTDYELNLLIIKDKSVCRAIQQVYIEKNPNQYVEKLMFHPDTNSIKSPVYVPIPESGQLTFSIPFAQNKSTYNQEDIEPFIKALKEPQFLINQLTITAFTSLEGGDKENLELQKKRAESILNAIKRRQIANITNKIITSDSWEMFKKDIVASKYSDMASQSQEEVKARLKGKTLKDLEPILAKHRFASILMDITYDITGSYEQPFVINKFNKLIEKGDFVNAFSVQKYIVQAVQVGKYNSRVASEMKITGKDKRYLPFWINYYFIQNYFRDITDEMCEGVAPLPALDPLNEYAYFDKMICNVMNAEITNETIMADLQANVDKAYSSKNIDKKHIDNLNLELQFKILEFADSSVSQTMLAAAEQSYERIKQIAMGLDKVTWQNSYKLADIFINHGDYQYAIRLMDPYIDNTNITTDFMFTYFSLLSHRQEYYLTPSFSIMAKRCLEADKARFCSVMKKFSFQVLENLEVKKIFCKECK